MVNGLQLLGLTIMGYAIAPTPDDALYVAGVAPGVIKDAGVFAMGMGTFLIGTFWVKR